MKLFTIISENIWSKPDRIQCWEFQAIPKQLALEKNPLRIYEVGFSLDSVVSYINNSIEANKCFLKNPCTIEKFLTNHDLWIEILRQSGDYIQYYRGEKPQNLCIEAVKQNGLSLQYIEGPYQTEEICLYAVNNDWNSLQYVKNQTEQVCRTAIEKDGKAIQHVREPTPELGSLSIRQGGGKEFLKNMPLDVCRIAVNMNGLFMEHIPAEKHVEELCQLAVRNNPYSLEWIHNQSRETCIIALQANGRTLQYVKVQTPELCAVALENTGMALQYVKEYMLPKICSYAVEKNIPSIHFIKPEPTNYIWENGFVYGIVFSVGVSILFQSIRARKQA